MSTQKLQIIGNFVKTDDTLTRTGYAADAQATGDAINQLQANIDEIAGLAGGFDGGYYTEKEIDSMMADLNAAIDGKSNVNHVHDDLYYTETEIDGKLEGIQSAIDSKVDAADGMGLSTNDYTTAEKDKLATIEDYANFYEHPTHTSYSLGLYKVTVDEFGHVSGATLAEKDDIVALGIPEQDTKYDTEISDFEKRISYIEDDFIGVDGRFEKLFNDFTEYKEQNDDAVADNAGKVKAHQEAIENIQNDYLTSTDKEQLQDDILKVSEKATTNATAIEVLNGAGDGSVKQSIDNAFNEFAANITNDNVVNTYKELIDYAAAHGPEFTTLVGEVDTIKTNVGEMETDFSDYKKAVSDQFTEVDTVLNNHVTDTDNPHGITKEQIGLDNVDNTSDLDKPISNAMQAALDEKAYLEHEHNDFYYTKDEILESITIEDIDDICGSNEIVGGESSIISYATKQWVQDGYQPKGNYLTEVPQGYATEEFVENKIAETELGNGSGNTIYYMNNAVEYPEEEPEDGGISFTTHMIRQTSLSNSGIGIKKGDIIVASNGTLCKVSSVSSMNVYYDPIGTINDDLTAAINTAPDWNAAEGEPGHILNRPFYSYIGRTAILEGTFQPGTTQMDFKLSKEETYSVFVNGVECVGVYDPGGEGFLDVLDTDGNEVGIYIFGYNEFTCVDNLTPADVELTVIGSGEIVEKIPMKYLDMEAIREEVGAPDTGGNVNYGAENAGKLLYIGADGTATVLALGPGLAIVNGVLTLTSAQVSTAICGTSVCGNTICGGNEI